MPSSKSTPTVKFAKPNAKPSTDPDVDMMQVVLTYNDFVKLHFDDIFGGFDIAQLTDQQMYDKIEKSAYHNNVELTDDLPPRGDLTRLYLANQKKRAANEALAQQQLAKRRTNKHRRIDKLNLALQNATTASGNPSSARGATIKPIDPQTRTDRKVTMQRVDAFFVAKLKDRRAQEVTLFERQLDLQLVTFPTTGKCIHFRLTKAGTAVCCANDAIDAKKSSIGYFCAHHRNEEQKKYTAGYSSFGHYLEREKATPKVNPVIVGNPEDEDDFTTDTDGEDLGSSDSVTSGEESVDKHDSRNNSDSDYVPASKAVPIKAKPIPESAVDGGTVALSDAEDEQEVEEKEDNDSTSADNTTSEED